jgi:hypothetical protein
LVVVMGFRYLVDASQIFVGNFVFLTVAENWVEAWAKYAKTYLG